MKITVKSSKIVKASVTKPAYRTRLSNNDVVMPKVYTCGVYFYKNYDQSQNFMCADRLTKSLSEVLINFYELSGRLVPVDGGNFEVNCNNEGVQFVVAEGDFNLTSWDSGKFGQLSLPDNLIDLSMTEGFLFKVEIIYLTDRSAILAIAMHHSLADGHGCFTFLKSWADLCLRNGDAGTIDRFEGTERKLVMGTGVPPRFDHPEYKIDTGEVSADETERVSKCIPHLTARIFHISKENLSKLKQKVMAQLLEVETTDKFVSTNDSLVALLWQAVTEARATDNNCIKLGMACNGRNRLSPALPDSYLGNVNFFVYCQHDSTTIRTQQLYQTALVVRQAVDKCNQKWLMDALNWVESQPDKNAIKPGFNSFLTDNFAITSWAAFPIYETDFGYGKPLIFRIAAKAFDGLAILLPAVDGGLDITIGLLDEAMKKLIANETMKNFCECIG